MTQLGGQLDLFDLLPPPPVPDRVLDWSRWSYDAAPPIEGRACSPTVDGLDLRCKHYDGGCECVLSETLHRARCHGCDWQGPIRSGCASVAVADAHDHAWPGWRDLPPAPGRTPEGAGAAFDKVLAKWLAKAHAAGYPVGWLEGGGPVVTLRGSRFATRDVPRRTPWGGYDLADRREVFEPA